LNSIKVVIQLGFVSTQRSFPYVEGVVEDCGVTGRKGFVQHDETCRSSKTLYLTELDELLQVL